MRHPPTAFLPPHAAMVRSAICYGSLMLLVVLTALPAFAASPDPFAYLYEETAPAKTGCIFSRPMPIGRHRFGRVGVIQSRKVLGEPSEANFIDGNSLDVIRRACYPGR
jgi:hypothetical protein